MVLQSTTKEEENEIFCALKDVKLSNKNSWRLLQKLQTINTRVSKQRQDYYRGNVNVCINSHPKFYRKT